MNILIVEDDPNLRLLWQSVIATSGHCVKVTASAVEARRILMSNSIDLVLLDLYLGQELGLSVASVATFSNPACKIVIVTGSTAMSCDDMRDKTPAISSVLRKPVDIEQLVAVCEHVGRPEPT